ncbi:hypothetical protein GEU84_000690 [Fertoebacter nigrum]|uniref:Uncharacterized protein n=1 Tax=Fertoeibacter niger TaxID=2656921 RepID=A0A8X8GRA6_9RHOB|nr:hypothetical protein [Fertoeibacter niger]NUB42888.1 hypothetical protein [Fertoeibacter niger]
MNEALLILVLGGALCGFGGGLALVVLGLCQPGFRLRALGLLAVLGLALAAGPLAAALRSILPLRPDDTNLIFVTLVALLAAAGMLNLRHARWARWVIVAGIAGVLALWMFAAHVILTWRF